MKILCFHKMKQLTLEFRKLQFFVWPFPNLIICILMNVVSVLHQAPNCFDYIHNAKIYKSFPSGFQPSFLPSLCIFTLHPFFNPTYCSLPFFDILNFFCFYWVITNGSIMTHVVQPLAPPS